MLTPQSNFLGRSGRSKNIHIWRRMAWVALFSFLVTFFIALVLASMVGEGDSSSFIADHVVAIFVADAFFALFGLISLFLSVWITLVAVKNGGISGLGVAGSLARVWIVPFVSIILFLCFSKKIVESDKR